MSQSHLRWGIIGTGQIATTFARALREARTGGLHAVASRSLDRAKAFGREYGAEQHYSADEDLLGDVDVDAVYIATPHPMHCDQAVAAAAAGKHILVEKPIGITVAQARTAIDAARAADVFLMEAFMYRCHPQTRRLAELVSDGAIGRVRFIRGTFSYNFPFDPTSRVYDAAYCGGGILDVGCYPVSMARLIAGAASGRPFADPVDVKACGHIGQSSVDEVAVAVLRFEDGIVAEAVTGVGVDIEHDMRVEVLGSGGRLVVPQPWIIPRSDGRSPAILLTRTGEQTEPIFVEAPEDMYAYEADEVASHLDARKSPAMTWDDTLGNMAVLDRWRDEIGLIFKEDRAGERTG